MKRIPYARQTITPADIEAVVEVLRSDWLTQGPAVERFEAAFAAYCNAPHAVALSSGTAALHTACLALGLCPGQRLWTSPNTFVASANCGLYCGADVEFVDIDPSTGNLSVPALASKLERASAEGSLPQVLVPVHFGGRPCDMRQIADLAARYGFRIVEDASHAAGAEYADGRVGNCAFSDITVFSFHPVKILTTGEGGMAFTADAELARRLRRMRTHGITRDAAQMAAEPEGAWYYEQIDLGHNYRMTDIQAALGVSQLARIGEFLERRRQLAGRYREALSTLPLELPPADDAATRSSWHLYVVRTEPAVRRATFESLRARGIEPNVHYIPVHLQPYYRKRGFKRGDYPAAERFYEGALSLPLFPGLSDAEQDLVCDALRAVLRC